MKPKLSSAQRDEIRIHIKNGVDISPLINNYSIAGEDFTGAVIKTFNRPDEDISGVVLANTVIGEDGQVNNLNRAIAMNCNFRRSTWKGDTWFRKANLSYTSMRDMFAPYSDLRGTNLCHCDFCGAIIQIITPRGIGAKFSDDFFKEFEKQFNVEIIRKKPNASHL